MFFFLHIHDQCSTKWVNHRDSTQKSLSAGYNLTTNLEENSSAWLPMQIGSSRSKVHAQNKKEKVEKQPMEPEKFDQKYCTDFFWVLQLVIFHVELFAYIPRLPKDFSHELSNVNPPPLMG